ncbi:DUF3150 domain-containing protein [Shewanella sp. MBTL60-007]|uniref:DUF3150 domain-containing protein n=1 Tax=Shewanella sp. MBTL60-007 TaxID=2815911 RepID=UPI001BC07553|nr:DUF3150 domain-containing protein [Shewanella sp. MBTL60-007]GIU20814.1 hypothetical protein TUM3792_20850 [Shewanella sp. MBTL60-007]
MSITDQNTTVAMYHIGTENSSGCYGTSTVPEAEITIAGVKVKNKNITKNTIVWMPSKYMDRSNPDKHTLRSTKVSSYVSSAFRRILREYSVCINDIYFVNTNDLEKVDQELAEVIETAESRLDDMVYQWDQILEEHMTHPDNLAIADLIKAHSLTAAEWRSKFSFKAPRPMHVTPVYLEDAKSLTETQTRQLYIEVVEDALKMLNELKDKKNQSFRTQLAQMTTKMSRLSFLDDDILYVVDYIEAVMNSLPDSGYLVDKDLLTLRELYFELSDPHKLKQFAINESRKATGVMPNTLPTLNTQTSSNVTTLNAEPANAAESEDTGTWGSGKW